MKVPPVESVMSNRDDRDERRSFWNEQGGCGEGLLGLFALFLIVLRFCIIPQFW